MASRLLLTYVDGAMEFPIPREERTIMSQPLCTEQPAGITTGGSIAGSCCSPSEFNDGEETLSGLMIGYQNGSLRGFTELYRRTKPHLTRVLLGIVDDIPSAELLIEQTFLEAHRARHTYIPPRPVTPWLEAIARHVALKYLRTRTELRR